MALSMSDDRQAPNHLNYELNTQPNIPRHYSLVGFHIIEMQEPAAPQL
jgi:hypothetical protein